MAIGMDVVVVSGSPGYPAPKEPKRAMPRVLLVDDYPDALETWRLYLELSGFEVVTAVDGQNAIEVALASQPDVIVMDLELPVMSGFDATQRLRELPETAETPIIAATGTSHFNAIDTRRLEAFDQLVVKPCDPAQLASQIRRLLGYVSPKAHAVSDRTDASASGTTEQYTSHNR